MACTIDFCCLDEGFGGKTYKRKRNTEAATDDEDAATEIDAAYLPPAKRSVVSSSDNPDKPVFCRPSYDGVIAGKVSGRKWEQPRKQRSLAVQVSRKGTTFEEREKNKSVKKAYKERMAEEIKRNKEEEGGEGEEEEEEGEYSQDWDQAADYFQPQDDSEDFENQGQESTQACSEGDDQEEQ